MHVRLLQFSENSLSADRTADQFELVINLKTATALGVTVTDATGQPTR